MDELADRLTLGQQREIQVWILGHQVAGASITVVGETQVCGGGRVPSGHKAPLGVNEGPLVPPPCLKQGVPWSDGPRDGVLSTCGNPADRAPLSSPTSPQSGQPYCSLLCPEHPTRLPRILEGGRLGAEQGSTSFSPAASLASPTGPRGTHGQFLLHIFTQPVPFYPLPCLPTSRLLLLPTTPKAFRDGTPCPSWDSQLRTRLWSP